MFTSIKNKLDPSVGILVLRLIAGAAMVLHGAPKLAHPLSWLGDSVPAILQLLAVCSEVGGGLAIILGLLTRIASLGVFFTMLVAVKEHLNWGDPLFRITISNSNEGAGVTFFGLPHWFALGGGHSPVGAGSAELALMFLIISFSLIFSGPGTYSLDHVIRGIKLPFYTFGSDT